VSSLKQNHVDGAWFDGTTLEANINPSNVSDVIGEYAQTDVARGVRRLLQLILVGRIALAFDKHDRVTSSKRRRLGLG
jgi:hypothetical protein